MAGQVVGHEAAVLNSVSIALFACCCDTPEAVADADLSPAKAISVLFTTRDLLDSNRWRVVAHRARLIPAEWLPYESTRESGFIGAKVIGSANVTSLANAYQGLRYWDDWHDPTYLDKLLRDPSERPQGLRFKKTV